jgi:molybdopterin converting factor small subunit
LNSPTQDFIATSEQVSWFRLSSVKVTVVYLGQAREVAGTKEEDLVLVSPARVEHAISQATNAHPRLSELKETIKLLINGQWASASEELKDGDRLTLLPPVGGG